MDSLRYPKTLERLFNEFGRILGRLELKVIRGEKLPNKDLIGKSDPFVECYLSSNQLIKLKT